MYSVCIFDFDYTLGDATDGIVESTNYAMNKLGYPDYPREVIRYTIGMQLPDAFTYLTKNSEKDKQEHFARLFVEKADKVMTGSTEFFPHSLDVLSYLKSKGIKTGIVTTKNHYRILEILNKFDVSHLFDIIIGGEDVKKQKPDPEALLTAVMKLGADKESVLYIGDSIIDAKTAQSAGVDFIAVTTGTTKREEFSAYPFIYVISSLSELIDKAGFNK